MCVESQLAQNNLKLPPAPKPAGNYSAFVRAGDLLFISGQLPIEDGALRYPGRVGAELTEEQGMAAARFAALNVLAQIRAALGGFERLQHLVRVEGHVAAAIGWHHSPKVLDAASDLFVTVLGEKGRHARAAFNSQSLPSNAAVELVVTVAVKPERFRQQHQ